MQICWKKCYSDQWWNNYKCQYECKKIHIYEKDYVWNPATISKYTQQVLWMIQQLHLMKLQNHTMKKQISMKRKQFVKRKNFIFFLHFYQLLHVVYFMSNSVLRIHIRVAQQIYVFKVRSCLPISKILISGNACIYTLTTLIGLA